MAFIADEKENPFVEIQDKLQLDPYDHFVHTFGPDLDDQAE